MAESMTSSPPRSPRSAGILLAIFPILGAIIGGNMGQPSLGLVCGTAVAAVAATVYWLVDRRRGN